MSPALLLGLAAFAFLFGAAMWTLTGQVAHRIRREQRAKGNHLHIMPSVDREFVVTTVRDEMNARDRLNARSARMYETTTKREPAPRTRPGS